MGTLTFSLAEEQIMKHMFSHIKYNFKFSTGLSIQMPLFMLKFFCSGLKEQVIFLIFNCICVINAGIKTVNTFLTWREVALMRCE